MEHFLNTLMNVLEPLLVAFVTIAVPILVKKASDWFTAKTKTTLSEADRAMIQSALANAAYRSIGKPGMPVVSHLAEPDIQTAIRYLKTSIPDTIRKKGLSDMDLVELVSPHLERVKLEKAATEIVPTIPLRSDGPV